MKKIIILCVMLFFVLSLRPAVAKVLSKGYLVGVSKVSLQAGQLFLLCEKEIPSPFVPTVATDSSDSCGSEKKLILADLVYEYASGKQKKVDRLYVFDEKLYRPDDVVFDYYATGIGETEQKLKEVIANELWLTDPALPDGQKSTKGILDIGYNMDGKIDLLELNLEGKFYSLEKQGKKVSDVLLLEVKKGTNITPTPTGKLIKATLTPTQTPAPTSTPTPIVSLPSQINGLVFQDKNKNGVRDANEPGLNAMIEINIFTAADRIERTGYVTANKEGKFTQSLKGPAKYSLMPTYYTFYYPPNSKIFNVSGKGEEINVEFPYVPQVAVDGIKIFVFNDKNENGQKDSDEENVYYAVAAVTYPDGNFERHVVAAEGQEITNIPFGHYKIELIPAEASYDYYFKTTKGTAEVDLKETSDRVEISLGAHKLH